MVFELAGVLLAALIQGLMISLYNLNFPCDTKNSTVRMIIENDATRLVEGPLASFKGYSKLVIKKPLS